MTILTKRRVGVAALLVACCALAGCSAGAASANPLPRAAGTRTAITHTSVARMAESVTKHSWVAPAAAKGRLLYVADLFANAVFIYTYPQLTGAGVLEGFGSVDGLCTDRRGYVWVLDTTDIAVWEFRHGGSQTINVLQPSSPSGNPGVGTGCAVDAKTGDLAVTGSGNGRLTVFRNGQNSQTTLSDFNFFQFAYLAYDNTGNLYVDGNLQSTFGFGLDEALAGTASLQPVALSGGSPSNPGGIQWDGTYLDIGDTGSGTIYQTNGATVLGTVTTTAVCKDQFYVTGNHDRIIVPDGCTDDVGIYKYPAGGSPLKTVGGGLRFPATVAISVPAR